MITEPRTDKTLDAIKNQLAQVVAPSVSDPSAATTLQFSILLLGDLLNRQRNEQIWLEEEIVTIERVVAEAVAIDNSDSSAPPQLREAHAAYLRQENDGASETAVYQRYSRAGRLLDAAVDAAFQSGNEDLIAMLREVIVRRLQREAELIGSTFEWVGRH